MCIVEREVGERDGDHTQCWKRAVLRGTKQRKRRIPECPRAFNTLFFLVFLHDIGLVCYSSSFPPFPLVFLVLLLCPTHTEIGTVLDV